MFLPLQSYQHKHWHGYIGFLRLDYSLPEITVAVYYAVHPSTTTQTTSSLAELDPLDENLANVIHTYVMFTLYYYSALFLERNFMP